MDGNLLEVERINTVLNQLYKEVYFSSHPSVPKEMATAILARLQNEGLADVIVVDAGLGPKSLFMISSKGRELIEKTYPRVQGKTLYLSR
jgi:hypothetical protein